MLPLFSHSYSEISMFFARETIKQDEEDSFDIFSMLYVQAASLASDVDRLTLASGMDNPMTIRYPELARPLLQPQ